MLRIEMAGGFGTLTTFGPAVCFELDGEMLRQGRERAAVASHVRHAWQAREQFFSSFEIHGPVLVTFVDRTRKYRGRRIEGPFGRMRIAGGFAYGDGRLIAEFLEAEREWRPRGETAGWPAIELRFAGTERAGLPSRALESDRLSV